MADTSLTFNLIGRDNVSRVLGVVKGAFTSAGQTATTAMDKASTATARLDRQIEETERDLAKLNAEFAATGDKTLFGKMARDRTLLTQLNRVRDDLARVNREAENDSSGRMFDRFRQGASAVGDAASAMGGFASTVGGVIGPLFGAAAAAAAFGAALAAIGPTTALAGGALGSLPGMLTGGAAAIGTLQLGLFGLGDEYKRLTKETGGGGGGGGGATKAAKDFTAANRAVEQAVKGVARAERDVRDAQLAALDAQRAVNDAREEASDRLRDQALDLKDSHLDQAEAEDALQESQLELNAAIKAGDPEKIDDAQRAYDRAVLSVERAKIRVQELTDTNAENAKKGVEGSDEVVQAKKREEDARRRVADAIEAEKEAEQRVADARKSLADQKAAADAPTGGGGGGGAAEKVTKLAPSARAFLNTIIGLRPAFEQLRLGVQERLFAGLSGKMEHLARVWKGPLTSTLNSYADTFNGIAKTFFDSASKKTFIDNVTAGAESGRKALDRIGQAVAGPLMDAFGRLSKAAGPFIEKIGDLIGRAVEKFSKWIEQADKSGKLKSFFEQAATMLEKVATVGGKAFTIAGQIIGILFGPSMAKGGGALDSANNALTKVSTWLENPKNQQGVRDFVQGFMSFAQWAFNAAKAIWDFSRKAIHAIRDVITWFKRKKQAVMDAWYFIKTAFRGGVDAIQNKGNQLVTFVRNLGGRITNGARNMWNGFKNAARSAFNAVARLWNGTVGRLSFTVPGWVPGFGGASFSVPSIPQLAQGGTIARAGMAIVGERGPELVSLNAGAQVTPLSRAGAGMPQQIVITIDPRGGDSELARLIAKMLRTQPAFAAAVKSATA